MHDNAPKARATAALREPSREELLKSANDGGRDTRVAAIRMIAARRTRLTVVAPRTTLAAGGLLAGGGAGIATVVEGIRFDFWPGFPIFGFGVVVIAASIMLRVSGILKAIEASESREAQYRTLIAAAIAKNPGDHLLSTEDVRRMTGRDCRKLLAALPKSYPKALRRAEEDAVAEQRAAWSATKTIPARELFAPAEDAEQPGETAPMDDRDAMTISEIRAMIDAAVPNEPRVAFMLRETRRRYLPDVIAAYRTAASADPVDAHERLKSHLALIRRGVRDAIAKDRAVTRGHSAASDQKALGRFLEATFGAERERVGEADRNHVS